LIKHPSPGPSPERRGETPPQPLPETERGVVMMSPPSLSGKGAGGLGE